MGALYVFNFCHTGNSDTLKFPKGIGNRIEIIEVMVQHFLVSPEKKIPVSVESEKSVITVDSDAWRGYATNFRQGNLCAQSVNTRSHVSVAGVMAGDYMECHKTTSFFWTHKMKQKGWIAFLSVSPCFFLSSRLDRLVAVATTQRRSLAHLHLRQGSPTKSRPAGKISCGKIQSKQGREENHHWDIKRGQNNSQLACNKINKLNN